MVWSLNADVLVLLEVSVDLLNHDFLVVVVSTVWYALPTKFLVASVKSWSAKYIPESFILEDTEVLPKIPFITEPTNLVDKPPVNLSVIKLVPPVNTAVRFLVCESGNLPSHPESVLWNPAPKAYPPSCTSKEDTPPIPLAIAPRYLFIDNNVWYSGLA